MLIFVMIWAAFFFMATVVVSVLASSIGTERMWPYAWPRLAVATIAVVVAIVCRSIGAGAWSGLLLLVLFSIVVLLLAIRRARAMGDKPMVCDPVATMVGAVGLAVAVICWPLLIGG
jgi:hypothetical protein